MSFSFKKEQAIKNIDENDKNIDKQINNNINGINNLKLSQNFCLYRRKMNEDEVKKGDITNLINKSFNDPSYYFSIQSPVQVGKKIKLKKLDLFPHKEGRRHSNLRGPQTKSNISVPKVSVTKSNKSISFGKQKKSDLQFFAPHLHCIYSLSTSKI